MATLIFEPADLRAMFTGQRLSYTYQETVLFYEQLRVHADGDVPIFLIQNARPNESQAVAEYRQEIYEPETQNPIDRVFGLFEKIRRSPDFMIRFDNDVPKIIAPDETPEEYLTEYFPTYGSIENWLFDEALRNVGLDANAVIIVMPVSLIDANYSINNNEYIEPIPRIFNSPNVIKFIDGDYVIVKSDEYSNLLPPEQQKQMQYLNKNGKGAFIKRNEIPSFIAGQVYYVVTTMYYQKFERNPEGKFIATEYFIHNLGELPAFQMPGKFVRRCANDILKKTLIAPMVPHLNKAARESNDLDAGVIMHLFLEKWRINNKKCKKCNGTGQVPSKTGPTECGSCKGSGIATGKSPFNEIEIKPAAIGEQNIPVPPVGFVAMDTQILILQNERVEQHIAKALASINMEHLADTPLNQSGTAKEWDNDSVNNIVYAFATMLVDILTKSIKYIIDLRYSNLIPSKDDRDKLNPIIPVPEKFDVINTSFLLQEYQSGKTAGLSSIILTEMQKEIAQKKFYANPEVSDFVGTVMDLDPFPDKTIEEKQLMESNSLATKEDIIMSNYISDFVKRSMQENPNFNKLSVDQKREKLLALAKQKLEELSTSNQIVTDIGKVGNGQNTLPVPPLKGNGVNLAGAAFNRGNASPNLLTQ